MIHKRFLLRIFLVVIIFLLFRLVIIGLLNSGLRVVFIYGRIMIKNAGDCVITENEEVKFNFILTGMENVSYVDAEFTYPKENVSISILNISFLVHIKHLSPNNVIIIELKIKPPTPNPLYYDDKSIQLDPMSFDHVNEHALVIRTLVEVKSELFGLIFPINTGIYWGEAIDGTAGFVFHRNNVITAFRDCFPVLFSILIMLLLFPARKRKPWLTVSLANISLLLYIFVGTGMEVLIGLKSVEGYLIALASQLFHRDYNHITGNLLSFMFCGILMETWALEKDSTKRYLLYYLSPYFTLMLLFSMREYYLYGIFPIGISGVISWFDTFLLYYIIRKELKAVSERNFPAILVLFILILYLIFSPIYWLSNLFKIYPRTTGYLWKESIIHLVPSGLGVIAAMIHYGKR